MVIVVTYRLAQKVCWANNRTGVNRGMTSLIQLRMSEGRHEEEGSIPQFKSQILSSFARLSCMQLPWASWNVRRNLRRSSLLGSHFLRH